MVTLSVAAYQENESSDTYATMSPLSPNNMPCSFYGPHFDIWLILV
jgi:hypothetical protein